MRLSSQTSFSRLHGWIGVVSGCNSSMSRLDDSRRASEQGNDPPQSISYDRQRDRRLLTYLNRKTADLLGSEAIFQCREVSVLEGIDTIRRAEATYKGTPASTSPYIVTGTYRLDLLNRTRVHAFAGAAGFPSQVRKLYDAYCY